MGTISYMSPEQVRGEVDELTPKSDAFSLGCLLYKINDGQRPFVGKSLPAIMQKITACEMETMSAMPDESRFHLHSLKSAHPFCKLSLKIDSRRRTRGTINAFLDGIEDRRRAIARPLENLEAGKTTLARIQA